MSNWASRASSVIEAKVSTTSCSNWVNEDYGMKKWANALDSCIKWFLIGILLKIDSYSFAENLAVVFDNDPTL